MASRQSIYYYSQIRAEVKKGRLAPIYFIYGEETYLVDALMDQICRKFIGEPQKEINYFIRYAPDASLDTILALMAGGGLFSEKKVVVLKDYQNLRNPDVKRLEKYARQPDANICLIVIARIDAINQAKYKAMRPFAVYVNLLPLRDADLREFVQEEFQSFGKRIDEEALQTLLYMVGEKIYDLKTEIAQVANFFTDKSDIKAADIEKIVGVHINQNVFQLVRLIAGKQLDKSLFILHNLLEKGENPGSVLFFLMRHMMMLWKIRGYYQSGIRHGKTIQNELKIFSRQYEDYIKDLDLWNAPQLRKAIQLVSESDRALKSSRSRPEIILDTLIFKLVRI